MYYICNLECLYASNGKIVSELFEVNFCNHISINQNGNSAE